VCLGLGLGLGLVSDHLHESRSGGQKTEITTACFSWVLLGLDHFKHRSCVLCTYTPYTALCAQSPANPGTESLDLDLRFVQYTQHATRANGRETDSR
jgi:hypothetical protein